MRRLVGVALLGLILAGIGCGDEGDETVTTTVEAEEPASDLIPVEVLTARVVKQCLSAGGAAVTGIESLAPEGSIVNAKGVFALGPGGGRIGVVIPDKPVLTDRLARELAGEGGYRIQKTNNGRAIVALESNPDTKDEALAAECVEG